MAASDLPTYKVALLAAISPQLASFKYLTTPFVSMANFGSCLAIMKTGSLNPTCPNVEVSIEQAQNSSGTGLKSISGKKFVFLPGGLRGNDQVEINLLASELDSAHGFSWIRMRIDVNSDASQVEGTLLGLDCTNPPASNYNIPGTCIIVT